MRGHDAFLYGTEEDFADTLVPFLRKGLARGEAAAVATTPRHIELLRDALGNDSADVHFVDHEEWYARPAATIAGWLDVLAEAQARGHEGVRIVGEVMFGSAAESPTWTRYEAALNTAIARSPAWVVCPYDLRLLPDGVIKDAARTHPTVWRDGRSDSDRYTDPATLLAQIEEPLPTVAGAPLLDLPIGDDLYRLRGCVRDTAAGLGFPPDRIDDLVLALSEVAANCLRYGAGDRRLTVWAGPGQIVCEIRDEGTGSVDPLAGYVPPEPGATSGMGLWLARYVSDALAIRTTPDGTAVRFAIGGGRPLGPGFP